MAETVEVYLPDNKHHQGVAVNLPANMVELINGVAVNIYPFTMVKPSGEPTDVGGIKVWPQIDFDYGQGQWSSADATIAQEQAAKAQQDTAQAKLQAEQSAKDAQTAQAQAQSANASLGKATAVVQNYAAAVSDKDAASINFIWPEWSGNAVKYLKGQVVNYVGKLYRVAQDHTTQADWTPDKTAALYSLIAYDSQGNRIWIKPTGAQDAFKADEVARYEPDGKLYKSKVDGNVWEPTKDGKDQWSEVTA